MNLQVSEPLVGEIVLLAATPVFSGPFTRDGDSGLFVIEALVLSGSFPVVGAQIEHKNPADNVDWIVVATFSPLTVPGQKRTKLVRLTKEWTRIRLTLAAGNSANVYVYMPQWRD